MEWSMKFKYCHYVAKGEKNRKQIWIYCDSKTFEFRKLCQQQIAFVNGQFQQEWNL